MFVFSWFLIYFFRIKTKLEDYIIRVRIEIERQKEGGSREEMTIHEDNDLVSKISFGFEVEGRNSNNP